MAYNEKFNTPLAIWTAFGGRGRLLPSMPEIKWKKLYYPDFGYAGYGSESKINVYDNGNAQIAVYYAKTPYMSYFNKSTKKWTRVSVAWWNNGAPEVLYAANGIFLAKIVGLANIIASFDGITWHNAGFCVGAKNAMICGAYDVSRNCGIVGFWYYETPIYYSYDSLETRTEWKLVGADGKSVPYFQYLTTHKGNFIGIVGGDQSISRASSSSPASWTTTIAKASSYYMFIRSVNDKLFVMKYDVNRVDGEYIYDVKLCVMNDSATSLTETNLSHVGNLADNRIPNPQNIVWMKEWGKFALLSKQMLHVSDDGLTWSEVEQPDLITEKLVIFEGAEYVEGSGFYVSGNGGYVYYGEC